MKLWKLLALVPYIPLTIWLLFSFSAIGTGTLGGVFTGAIILAGGLYATMVYTASLVFALVLRFIILKLRGK